MKFIEASQKVKEKVNIIDIIGKYVKLEKRGKYYYGICPFHKEKVSSFSVSKSKQIFKCFGCGKAGNVNNFLMEKEGMTFSEAVKFLASQVNITIEDKTNEDKKSIIKRILDYFKKYI